MDEVLAALSARAIELVGAHVDEGRGVAVVGVLEDDHVFAAGVGAGQAQGQLVGLAAGVHEEADAQGLGQEVRQPLGVAVDVVVEVARVGVEQRDLALHRADHARVAVPHEGHVVVDVEEGAAGLVVEEGPEAAHDLEGPAVREAQAGAQPLAAGGQGGRGLRGRGGEALLGNAQDQVGIGREGLPDLALRGAGHAGEVAAQVEQVEDDLEVHVGRPVAVRGRRPHPADLLAGVHALAHGEAREGVLAQVTVEREEDPARVGLVPEDDERPVVLRRRVVREGVDDPGQGRADGRAGSHEQIDRRDGWCASPRSRRRPRRRGARRRAAAPRRSGRCRPGRPPCASRRRSSR